jgi:hypothetical protein
MKYMFGLKGCGEVKFLLDHLGYRPGKADRQRIPKKTVQQIEFFFLSNRVCFDGFHDGLYASHQRDIPEIGPKVNAVLEVGGTRPETPIARTLAFIDY